jgi:hypothetical protein
VVEVVERRRGGRPVGRALRRITISALVVAAVTVAVAAPAHADARKALMFVGPVWSELLDDQGGPVAESSPNLATLDGLGPAVVVGDRTGSVYAFHLTDGSPVSGWPANVGYPVDSTPSVARLGGGSDTVFVGTGDAAEPIGGGYAAISAAGRLAWYARAANPPEDPFPEAGVQASLAVGALRSGLGVVAGSLGQETYALSAASGGTLPGWPFYASDSNFSTPALRDLYGTGQLDVVEGGDQTAGFALGQFYAQGGHLRVLNAQGGLICDHDTDQTVDSSPAVGDTLIGGTTGIVVGTGSFFAGARDSDTVQAFDTRCQKVWSARLDGSTASSPALSDVEGDGHLDVVEGTDLGQGGSVWVLDGATGQTVWRTTVVDRVIGSVVTADLTGQGYQDVLVPTIHGVEILDGRSGTEVTVLAPAAGFQNAPLVTDDANGAIGITIAGYNGDDQGVIYHYEVPSSNGAEAVGSGSWPGFHRDPSVDGNAGGPLIPAVPGCYAPSAARQGYQSIAADGGVFAFGEPFCGSLGGIRLVRPVVAAANAPGLGGYWMVASDGGVFTFGQARFYGSLGGVRLAKPIVGMAATPDGGGYWLVASDGGVFTFGDARFYGSEGETHLVSPVVGMAASTDGRGYRLVAADGGVFTFGDARFFGSTGGVRLAQPIVGMATDSSTGGYWLVAADGGIFSFFAPFLGSTGGVRLARPVVAVEPTVDGHGYRLVASDGGTFTFGDALFFGSTGGMPLASPVVTLVGS